MAEMHHTPDPARERGKGHETRDADAVRLLQIGGGLLVLIVAIMLLVWGLYTLYGEFPYRPSQPSLPSTTQQNVLPPEPRLQPLPQEDLAKMRVREDSILNSYGWVNQQAGIARIPIDSAMAMIARQGLPYRSAPDGLGGGGKRTGRMTQ